MGNGSRPERLAVNSGRVAFSVAGESIDSGMTREMVLGSGSDGAVGTLMESGHTLRVGLAMEACLS